MEGSPEGSTEPRLDNTPPDYVYDLIKISIFSNESNVSELINSVKAAKAAGADKKEILRAMFRHDESLHSELHSGDLQNLAKAVLARDL